MGNIITKELLDSSTNEELLEIYNKIEEHLKFLNESIIKDAEEEKDEANNE